jgi:hypothetical protein
MAERGADEKARYEQTLMRMGRKLQSLGQLLEQAPSHLVAKGFPSDPAINGNRPVIIDMDEMKALFDTASTKNVADTLREYHDLLRRLHEDGS